MAETQAKQQYPFYFNDQFFKDLSFENPNFLIKYNEKPIQPEVSVSVETGVKKISDNNYEVSMSVNITSTADNKNIFVMQLEYAALVSTEPEMTNEVLEPVLLVHCPFLMFPFVREIVSNITRSGGYPPLLIEPIDFAALFMEKKKATEDAQHQVN